MRFGPWELSEESCFSVIFNSINRPDPKVKFVVKKAVLTANFIFGPGY